MHNNTFLKIDEALSAVGRVVGDSPYRDTSIQPWDVFKDWDLNPWEASILKRLQRWRRPGGKGLQDLEKMAHELQYLIESEKFNMANSKENL